MTQLTERAMLVCLHISQWTARKHDKAASAEVADTYGANVNVGRYTKSLIDKDALRDICRIARDARGHHDANTLPWTDTGFRILPGANYFDYTEAQRGFRTKFETAVKAFAGDYADHRDQARNALKGLFSITDYPSPDEIAAKFRMETSFLPLPDAADFRVTLGAAEEARIRADIEARVKGAADAAMRDLWKRVHDTVARMSDRLNAYGVDADTGKVINPFRDSLVGNLRDLAELLPKLNIAGDPQLEDMRERLVASLCPHDPQALRDSPTLRQSVAREADQILADMAGYVGAAAA